MSVSRPDRILIEVCVDNLASAEAAVEGGADRIELCAALSEGGLTPSLGLMHFAARLPVPVFAMIRPRGGHFRYSDAELGIMLRDIDAARSAGLAGVVLGATTEDGELDRPGLSRLCHHADGMARTLHRAVDTLTTPLAAVDIARDLGFDRILTSGGANTADDGADVIAAMIDQAGDAIVILPGAGITATNARRIIAATGARELHGSFSTPDADGQHETSARHIQAVRHALVGR